VYKIKRENFNDQPFGTLIHSYCFNKQLLALGHCTIGSVGSYSIGANGMGANDAEIKSLAQFIVGLSK
jgi:hypothetical protein